MSSAAMLQLLQFLSQPLINTFQFYRPFHWFAQADLPTSNSKCV